MFTEKAPQVRKHPGATMERKLHMEIVPDQGSQAADPGIVAEGIAALSLFGGDLDLMSATRLLSMWHYNKHLSAAQRAAILEHFTPGGAR